MKTNAHLRRPSSQLDNMRRVEETFAGHYWDTIERQPAWLEGYKAGAVNSDKACPYRAGSKEEVLWSYGYTVGDCENN